MPTKEECNSAAHLPPPDVAYGLARLCIVRRALQDAELIAGGKYDNSEFHTFALSEEPGEPKEWANDHRYKAVMLHELNRLIPFTPQQVTSSLAAIEQTLNNHNRHLPRKNPGRRNFIAMRAGRDALHRVGIAWGGIIATDSLAGFLYDRGDTSNPADEMLRNSKKEIEAAAQSFMVLPRIGKHQIDPGSEETAYHLISRVQGSVTTIHGKFDSPAEAWWDELGCDLDQLDRRKAAIRPTGNS